MSHFILSADTPASGAPVFKNRAACAGLPPSAADRLFFNMGGTIPNETKALCGGCPAREECREHGKESSLGYGIWAGEWSHKLVAEAGRQPGGPRYAAPVEDVGGAGAEAA